MIKRYAIEPTALRRWEDFRYVMEKLGFSQGRVLVALPRKWAKELLESLSAVGDIERTRFVEKLRVYKNDRIIPSGTEYSRDAEWVDNAIALEARGVVEAILISQETSFINESLDYPTPASVDEQFFNCVREMRCLGTPENLSAAAKILLEVSEEAALVDPYFRVTEKAYLRTLVEFAKIRGRCRSFWIFAKSDFAPKGGLALFRSILDKEMAPHVKRGFEVGVSFIDSEITKINFHARYLLTNKGGIRYDKGFGVKPHPELVDISLLDDQINAGLREVFSITNRDLGIAQTWTWKAEWG